MAYNNTKAIEQIKTEYEEIRGIVKGIGRDTAKCFRMLRDKGYRIIETSDSTNFFHVEPKNLKRVLYYVVNDWDYTKPWKLSDSVKILYSNSYETKTTYVRVDELEKFLYEIA